MMVSFIMTKTGFKIPFYISDGMWNSTFSLSYGIPSSIGADSILDNFFLRSLLVILSSIRDFKEA
jgi:hypothetical protein